MQVILVLFLVLIFLLVNISYNEKFTVVGYNNTNIPKYTIPNEYNTTTQNIQQQLIDTNPNESVNPTNYTLYNPNLPFPFNQQFTNIISHYLLDNNIAIGIKNIGTPTNIYYTDLEENRIFIFTVSIIDNLTSRNFIVKIIVNNINKYIDQYGNYLLSNNSSTLSNRRKEPEPSIGKILAIRLSPNNYPGQKLTWLGLDELNPNFYETYNTLYLMDPFITSGNQMIITPFMQQKFQKTLELAQAKNKVLNKFTGINNA